MEGDGFTLEMRGARVCAGSKLGHGSGQELARRVVFLSTVPSYRQISRGGLSINNNTRHAPAGWQPRPTSTLLTVLAVLDDIPATTQSQWMGASSAHARRRRLLSFISNSIYAIDPDMAVSRTEAARTHTSGVYVNPDTLREHLSLRPSPPIINMISGLRSARCVPIYQDSPLHNVTYAYKTRKHLYTADDRTTATPVNVPTHPFSSTFQRSRSDIQINGAAVAPRGARRSESKRTSIEE